MRASEQRYHSTVLARVRRWATKGGYDNIASLSVYPFSVLVILAFAGIGFFLSNNRAVDVGSFISGFAFRPAEVLNLPLHAPAKSSLVHQGSMGTSNRQSPATRLHTRQQQSERERSEEWSAQHQTSLGASLELWQRAERTEPSLYSTFIASQGTSGDSSDGTETGFAALEVAVIPEPAAGPIVAIALALLVTTSRRMRGAAAVRHNKVLR